MSISANIKNGAMAVVTVFALVGSIWGAQAIFATDQEVAVVEKSLLTEVHQVSIMHDLDKVSAEEARKNDRIDRVDRDIRKLNRLIEFGDPAEREYNKHERAELLLLKQHIVEGHR